MTGIRWFRPMERGIIIGTDTSLWIASISLEKGFDPTVRRLASLGVYNAFPLSVSDGLVFVQGAGRKIQAVSGAREQGFNFVDLTRYVDHLFDYRISQMAYQEDPYSILWVVTGDGKLCGCTLTTQSEGGAWHTHKIGGRGVKVVSMSTCVCVDQGETTLWLLVSRINEQGEGVRGVGLEKLSAFQPSDDHGDGLFLKGE